MFRLFIVTYRLLASAKTDTETCNTYLRIQTDGGNLAFRFCGPQGRHQESYLPVQRAWTTTVSFVIHVNFDLREWNSTMDDTYTM